MKKILSLILAFAMCLSLCACGKSEEVKAVEEMITAIGTVSTESCDAITAAEEAYSALSPEDKEKVENYTVLTNAKTALGEIVYASLIQRLSEINEKSEILASGIICTWGNVGVDDFWTYFNNVLRFKDDTAISAIMSMEESDLLVIMSLSGWALNKAYFSDGADGVRFAEPDEYEYITSLCKPIASAYVTLPEMSEELNKEVTYFFKEYKDSSPERAQVLQEWFLESSMYVDFSLNPAGSLANYKSQLYDYAEAMARFQKQAELLK